MNGVREININNQQCKIPHLPLTILIALILVTSCSINKEIDVLFNHDVIATVNSQPISIQLFQQRLSLNRAAVYSYFHQKYTIDNPSGFWSTKYGEEIPSKVIKKRAIDECVEIKIQQILAKNNGVTRDITYRNFLEDLKRENLRRKDILANNGVIYGPEQYTEKTYFEYVFSNMQIRLKTKLGQDTFHISDGELQKFHELRKSKKQKTTDSGSTRQNVYVFDEFKEQIRAEYVNEKYEELVKQNILQVNTLINKKAYDGIEIK